MNGLSVLVLDVQTAIVQAGEEKEEKISVSDCPKAVRVSWLLNTLHDCETSLPFTFARVACDEIRVKYGEFPFAGDRYC